MIKQTPSRRRGDKDTSGVNSSLEEKLMTLTAQVDLLKAQVRQVQQLASLGTAAAMIAHEVNNLLTPILAYVDSALQGNDIEFAKKALTITARNARMLIAMSGRMLELGAAKPQKVEKTDIRLAVTDALASLCRDLEKDGITFAMKVDDGLCVLADPLHLRQVLFNLFLNAREAMAPSHSGRLTVSAQRENGQTRIEVRNTGPAIPPELLPAIFEPFQSTKAASNGKARCSGLGLALVRDLIQENGGSIAVTSNAESGTTFRIVLPTGN